MAGISAATMRVSVSPDLGKKIWVVVVVITRLPRWASSLARVYIVVVLPPAPTMEMSGLAGRSMRSESDDILDLTLGAINRAPTNLEMHLVRWIMVQVYRS